MKVAKRYTTLRFIGNFLKFIGVLITAFAILTACSACFSLQNTDELTELGTTTGTDTSSFAALSVIGSIVLTFYSFSMGIIIYGLGEAVFVFLAIEENTRATAMALQIRKQASSGNAGQLRP